MGALTIKPYAFLSRAWELEKIESIDFFDIFGSSLYLELRGFEIIRILPKINYFVNGEWLTDRARFFIDGLLYQRLVKPLFRIYENLVGCSWSFVFLLFFFFRKLMNGFYNFNNFNKIIKRNGSVFFIDFMIGEDEDLVRIGTLDFFKNLLGNSISLLNLDIIDFVDSFDFFPSFSNQLVDNVDLIILIGFDSRVDTPLLYHKLYEFVSFNNSINVIGFGCNDTRFNFSFFNGGSVAFDFVQFFSGRHMLSKLLLKTKRVLFFFGVTAMGFYNSKKIFLKKIANTLNFNVYFIPFFSVNGLSYLNAGLLGFFSGLKDKFVARQFRFNFFDYFYFYNYQIQTFFNYFNISFFSLFSFELYFLFLINNNNCSFNFRDYDFIVYLGHHGDDSVNKVNPILPFTLIYERNNIYINVFNLVRRYDFITFIDGFGGNKKDTLNFLFIVIFYFLDIFNIMVRFKGLKIFYKCFFYKFVGEDEFFCINNIVQKEFKINNFEFFRLAYNFFKVDSVSRSSRVLNLAGRIKFLDQKYMNYKKYV